MAWAAKVEIMSGELPVMNHVIGRIIGDTESDALAGAEFVLNSIASDKVASIRCKPESDTWTDFDTKEVMHRGYVRFSVADQSGDWQYAEGIAPLPLNAAA